jgi:glycosyltransferase involved in cell wall biosynthesis
MFAIYDDIINDLQNSGGISVYWHNLKIKLKNRIEIECYNGSNIKRDRKAPLLIQRYLNFNSKKESKHIFHSSYYRVSRNINALNIVTVHDFVYEYYSKGLKKLIHKLQKKYSIFNAHGVICISENTKKDLLKLYPQIDKNKIRVIYHGVSEEFFNTRNFNNDNTSKSLIFVGQRNGYKNFQILIDVLDKKKEFNLVLVGGGSLTKYEKNKLKNINYKHHQNISNTELNILYNNSYALIYPSLYEGFGLPILESLKAGCPVICNDGSSTKEIGDKYVLKGEMTTDFIIDSLEKLMNKKYRQKLILEGINYSSTFTWEKTAKETLDLYKQLWEEFQ